MTLSQLVVLSMENAAVVKVIGEFQSIKVTFHAQDLKI